MTIMLIMVRMMMTKMMMTMIMRKGEGRVSGAYWQFHCLLDIHSYKGADWGQSTTLCNAAQITDHCVTR